MSVWFLEAFELVLVNDFSWNEAKENLNVFFPFHGSIEVKIFQVEAEPFCFWVRKGGVDEYFGGNHVSSWCANVARVVNEVAADGESCALCFLLLWSNSADKFHVGGRPSCWEVCLFDWPDCLCARGHVGSYSFH